MQSPTTVEAPPAKPKYVKKDKPDSKEKTQKKKKTKWETDSALKTDPAKETPEPVVVEKSYVMKEGHWVEEEGEKNAAIEELMAEVDKITQIESPPQAPLGVVDLLTCPFHLKPLTR